MPNGLGQIRLQRVLMGRALAAAQAGHTKAAARSLEASWSLNESLAGRPEMMSSLMGIAIARFEVGVLRKVDVEEDLWRKRLAALDPRATLLDTLGLEYRPASARNLRRHVSTSGDSASWYQRFRDFLVRPADRFMMVDYSDLMRVIKSLGDGFLATFDGPARAIRCAMMGELSLKHWKLLVENVGKGDTAIFNAPVFPKGTIEGVGLHEAPRGTLSHWCVIEDGKLKNYQAVVPSTWNAGPRDEKDQAGPYEACLVGNPIADPKLPLEALRTIHSFDPCLACAIHTVDAEGTEIARVRVA